MQITISYIDEGLPFEERQALLADYGFRCECSKCLEETQFIKGNFFLRMTTILENVTDVQGGFRVILSHYIEVSANH